MSDTIIESVKHVFSNIEWEHLLFLVLSSLTWLSLYKIGRKWVLKEKSGEYICRVLTIMHGLLAIGFCFTPSVHRLLECTECKWIDSFELLALANTGGFILFEMIWGIFNHIETPLMGVHHSICIYTTMLYLSREIQRDIIVTGLGLMEITNPLLQLRWFLKQHGKQEETYFQVLEYTFCITFFIIRAIVATIYAQQYLQNPSWEMVDKVTVLLFYSIGWIFVVNITLYLIRKLREPSQETGHIMRGQRTN